MRFGNILLLLAALDAAAAETSPNPSAFPDQAIAKKDRSDVTERDRQWWAFQPLKRTAPPKVNATPPGRAPIDLFILARLDEKKLQLNPPADRRTLIRRASFDLLGLPPTPEETEEFQGDKSSDAWPRLLARLLDSPRFGERGARHWLDVARFAESSGFEHDYDRPNAYHYRDFVIKALNDDMPFDQFVRWQLAGDEFEPDNPLALIATGFLGAGVFPTQITANEVERVRYDAMDDMLATTGTAMLGLTIGCARCHDHKFDPIPTRDYYRMLSTFTTTVRSDIDLDLEPEANRRAREKFDRDHTQLIAALRTYGESDPAWLTLQAKLEAHSWEAPKPKLTKVLVCAEGYPALRMHTQGADFFKETHFLQRGSTELKQAVASPGFLQVLIRDPELEKRWSWQPPAGAKFSGRRRSLANWMTDTEHGAGHLLARVILNRIWQQHFGQGLVATPNDFGVQGAKPTHPELLDWLAGEFIRGGWRLKPLHQLIMTSAVYQQDSRVEAAKLRADPSNALLSRRVPQRLQAEAIRDSLLFVSGLLATNMFGPGTLDEASRRRSVYFTVKRSRLIPAMQAFDAPEPLVSQGTRPTTTVAPQALWLMNSPPVRSWARAFAHRLAPDPGQPLTTAVNRAYALALNRAPTKRERADTIAFIEQQTNGYRAEQKSDAGELALTDFAQVLLSLNEFIYVD